MPQDTNR